MLRIITLVLCYGCLFQTVYAQTWRVHLNGHEYYPLNNDEKGYFPILWYSPDNDRGILLGGFGGGVSYTAALRGHRLRTQLNAQRSRFYDVPSIFRDENGQPLGAAIGINTNLNISILCMPEFNLIKSGKLYFATGLGFRSTVWSRSNYGTAFVNGVETTLKLKDKSPPPFVLLLPLELGWKMGKRFRLSVRAEYSLTRVSNLSAYAKERGLTLVTEVSCALK